MPILGLAVIYDLRNVVHLPVGDTCEIFEQLYLESGSELIPEVVDELLAIKCKRLVVDHDDEDEKVHLTSEKVESLVM